jgi:hypothetical protein
MRHIGIKPMYPLEMLDFKRKIYLEEMPDGQIRLWNKRMLKSGCGNTIEPHEYKEVDDCIYCPYCDEFFSYEQWESSDEYRETTQELISDHTLCVSGN